MKIARMYEVDYFGDFVIPAVACGLKKKLLVFNTNPNYPRCPIDVVSPVQYGINPNTPIPVILSYDMVHYENLIPVDDLDLALCIDLVE